MKKILVLLLLLFVVGCSMSDTYDEETNYLLQDIESLNSENEKLMKNIEELKNENTEIQNSYDDATKLAQTYKEKYELIMEDYSELENKNTQMEIKNESDISLLHAKLEFAKTSYVTTSNLLMMKVKENFFFDPRNIHVGDEFGDFVVDFYETNEWIDYSIGFIGETSLEGSFKFDSYGTPIFILSNDNNDLPIPIKYLNSMDTISMKIMNSDIFDDINDNEIIEGTYVLKISSISYFDTSVGTSYWIYIDEYYKK